MSGPSKHCLAIVGLSIACGPGVGPGDTAPEADSGGVDDGADDDRTDGMPPVPEITIPMRPRATGELYAVPTIGDDGGPRMQFDASLTLAVADGYPTEFTAALPEQWWATCGLGVGAIRLSPASVTGDAVSVNQPDPTTVVLAEYRAGATTHIVADGELTLDGESCGYPSGTTVAVDFTLSVSTRAIGGSRIEPPCAGPVVIATSSRYGAVDRGPWAWFSAHLLDVDEAPLYVDNAEPDAQVDVVLRGSFDAGHAAPAHIGAWVAPSRAGLVEITPTGGPTLAVDVADADRVTGAALNFQIAGAAAGSLIVEDGGDYGTWGRKANRLAPMVQSVIVDDRPLCSQPDPTWFQLRTETPAQCSILELPHAATLGEDYLLSGDRIGHAARLDRDGTCALVVDAPAFDPTAQFPRRFAASFRNVDKLLD
ncbi:MAG: hypothetical protein AAF721_34030 [Myxococcota bacterium]